MTKKKPIRIATIADMFKHVPQKRIDAFLIDLGNLLRSRRTLEKNLGILARSKMTMQPHIDWIDDGEHDVSIVLEGKGEKK